MIGISKVLVIIAARNSTTEILYAPMQTRERNLLQQFTMLEGAIKEFWPFLVAKTTLKSSYIPIDFHHKREKHEKNKSAKKVSASIPIP